MNDKGRTNVNDFEIIRVIGIGGHSKVYLAQKKDTKEFYAMKILVKERIEAMGERAHTFNERTLLSWLVHPFILKMHYCFQDETKLYIVLDIVTGGDLFFNLQREESGRFDEERVRFYAAQLVLLLEFLQGKCILYRDIKPENLLISSNGYLILCDFGLAKEGITKTSKTKTFCGTSCYYAPEIIQGKEYGRAVDWWQVGTLMYELLTGEPPFYHDDEGFMFRNICSAPLKMPSDFPEATKDIITAFLERDPENRLQDVNIIKSHPYFEGIDWQKLKNQEIKAPFIPDPVNPEDLDFVDEEDDCTFKKKKIYTPELWPGWEFPA